MEEEHLHKSIRCLGRSSMHSLYTVFSDIVLQFESTSYTVSEVSGLVTIGVLKQGLSEIPVNFSLSTANVTAAGEFFVCIIYPSSFHALSII